MFSRRLQITLALSSMLALGGALVAVNTRLSWRPVSVDFAPASVTGSTHFPVAWRGDRLWLLSQLNGATSNSVWKTVRTPQWKIVRNWNHKPLPVMLTNHPWSGFAATLCSSNDWLARARAGR